ncbi:MAG: hypothetical protein HYZ29_07060 [Myxococcales bacterium]|nr:hypothetical protein [Myxococcales bacterium]
MGRVLSAVAVVLACAAACTSNPSDATGCSSEADCKTDEVCAQGACVKITPDAGSDASADAQPDVATACLGKQPSPTAGGHCGCSADCDSSEVCLDEVSTGVPGGQCMRACSGTTCPGDLLCLEFTPGMADSDGCARKCTTSKDCPSGQICQTLESGGPLVCMPLCQSDSDCPAVKKCDPYSGFCLATPKYEGSKETGEACADDKECKSELCLAGIAAFPGGYCSAFCSLEKQGCPQGSHCMPIWSDVGDQGLCLKKCTDVSECRPEYGCVGSSQVPGVTVCGPKKK